MKIMVLEGVRPPRDGKILVRQRPLSVASVQMSHSSKIPKSESAPQATPSNHGSAIHTTSRHTETASPFTPELQTTST